MEPYYRSCERSTFIDRVLEQKIDRNDQLRNFDKSLQDDIDIAILVSKLKNALELLKESPDEETSRKIIDDFKKSINQ